MAIFTDDCSSLGTWTDASAGSGTVEISPAGQIHLSDAANDGQLRIYRGTTAAGDLRLTLVMTLDELSTSAQWDAESSPSDDGWFSTDDTADSNLPRGGFSAAIRPPSGTNRPTWAILKAVDYGVSGNVEMWLVEWPIISADYAQFRRVYSGTDIPIGSECTIVADYVAVNSLAYDLTLTVDAVEIVTRERIGFDFGATYSSTVWLQCKGDSTEPSEVHLNSVTLEALADGGEAITGYGHFRKFTVPGEATAGEDYQAKVVIDKTTGGSGDFDLGNNADSWPYDLRFTDAANTYEMFHWREDYDADSQTVWVKIPDDVSLGSVALTAHFGKTSDSDHSDIGKTFVFGDEDFSTLDTVQKWTVVAGDVDASGNSLLLTGTAGTPGQIDAKNYGGPGRAIRTKAVGSDTIPGVHHICSMRDVSTPSWDDRVDMYFYNATPNLLGTQVKASGTASTSSYTDAAITTARVYEARWQTGNAYFYQDGVLESTLSTNVPSSVLLGPSFLEASAADGTATVDWVVVRECPETELSVGQVLDIDDNGVFGYPYNRTITRDGSDQSATVQNFPMEVQINSASWPDATERGHFFDASNVGGKRVTFATDAGIPLYYRVRDYDASGQEAVYLVQVPSILPQASGAEFTVYFGDDPYEADQDNPTSVWDSDHKCVIFGTSLSDETVNGNDATNTGTATSADGPLDQSRDFESGDTTDRLATTLNDANDLFYWSGWVKLESYGQNSVGRIFDNGGLIAYGFSSLGSGVNGLEFFSNFVTVDGAWQTPNNSLPTGSWKHVAIGYDRSSLSNDPFIVIDGANKSLTERQTPVGAVQTGSANIIGNNAAAARAFDGLIAESRFSVGTVRSTSWAIAEYWGQADTGAAGWAGSDVITFGAENSTVITDLDASLVGTTATLTWTDVAGNDGYKIYRDTSSPATTLIDTVATADLATYEDAGLTPGETYFYRIAPYAGSVDGAYSNEDSVTVPWEGAVAQTITITQAVAGEAYTPAIEGAVVQDITVTQAVAGVIAYQDGAAAQTVALSQFATGSYVGPTDGAVAQTITFAQVVAGDTIGTAGGAIAQTITITQAVAGINPDVTETYTALSGRMTASTPLSGRMS